MFGKIIEKYCPTCEKDMKITVSTGYWIDGKSYYDGDYCHTCGTDLCEEDRKAVV